MVWSTTRTLVAPKVDIRTPSMILTPRWIKLLEFHFFWTGVGRFVFFFLILFIFPFFCSFSSFVSKGRPSTYNDGRERKQWATIQIPLEQKKFIQVPRFFLVCFVECPHILRGGGGQTFFRLYKYTANVHESGTSARCVAARRCGFFQQNKRLKIKIKQKLMFFSFS